MGCFSFFARRPNVLSSGWVLMLTDSHANTTRELARMLFMVIERFAATRWSPFTSASAPRGGCSLTARVRRELGGTELRSLLPAYAVRRSAPVSGVDAQFGAARAPHSRARDCRDAGAQSGRRPCSFRSTNRNNQWRSLPECCSLKSPRLLPTYSRRSRRCSRLIPGARPANNCF